MYKYVLSIISELWFCSFLFYRFYSYPVKGPELYAPCKYDEI